MRHLSVFLGLAFLLLGCSDSEPDKAGPKAASTAMTPAPGTADVEALIPKDAAYLVRIESLARLDALAQLLATDTGAPIPTRPMQMLAPMFGIDPSVISADKPLFIAMGPEAGPAITLIAPTRDPQTVAAAFKTGKSKTTDAYVALSMDPKYAGGGGDRIAGMPGGAISVRCDIARLRAHYGDQIDAVFKNSLSAIKVTESDPQQAAGAEIAESLLTWARQLSDSVQRLDLSLSEQEGEVDLQIALATDGKGPLAKRAPGTSSLLELGSGMPDELALCALFRVNFAEFAKLSGSGGERIAAKLPAEKRAKLEAYMRKMEQLNAMLGTEWAFGIDILDSGIRGAMVGTAKDAAGYMRAYNELIQDPAVGELAMRFAAQTPRKVGSVAVTTFRLQLDADTYLKALDQENTFGASAQTVVDAILGKEGLLIETAVRGDRVYIGIGSTSMMDSMLKATTKPNWIAAEEAATTGDIRFLMRLEPVKLVRGGILRFGHLAPDDPPPPAPNADPTPITMSATVDGDVYRLHLRAHPGRLAALLRELMGR